MTCLPIFQNVGKSQGQELLLVPDEPLAAGMYTHSALDTEDGDSQIQGGKQVSSRRTPSAKSRLKPVEFSVTYSRLGGGGGVFFL